MPFPFSYPHGSYASPPRPTCWVVPLTAWTSKNPWQVHRGAVTIPASIRIVTLNTCTVDVSAHLTPISIVYSLCAVYLQHLVVIGLEQKAWKKSSVQWAVPAAKWAFQACHVCRRSGFRGASFPGHIGKQHLVATGRGVYKGACWRSDIPDGWWFSQQCSTWCCVRCEKKVRSGTSRFGSCMGHFQHLH